MRRLLLLAVPLALGLALGLGLGRGADRAPLPVPSLGPSAAWAGDVLPVGDGQTFVTSDGPNAWLWRRAGDRLELVGQATRTHDGPEGQATWVWLPGVERRS